MVVGPFSLLVIAVLVLMFFGASRLGDVGRSLGQGVRAFKKGMQTTDDDESPKPKRRKLEIEPIEEDEADEGVPMRKRIALRKPSAKKLVERNDPEDPEDEKEG